MFTPPSISGRLPYKDAKPQDSTQQETASVDAADAATAESATATAFYQLSTDTVVGLSDRIQLLLSAHDAELQRAAKEAAQKGQNPKANSNPLGLKPGKTLLESVGGNAALAEILSRYQARAQVSTDNSFFADYAKVMPLVSMRVHANDVNAPSRGAAWHLAHCIDSDEVLDRTLTHLTTISHLVGAAVNHEVVHCTPHHIDDEILLNTSDIFAKMPTWTLTLDVSDCPECAPVTGIMVSRIVLIKPEEHVKHLPTYSDTQTVKHGQPFAEFLAVSISQNNKLFTPINHPLILDAENCVNDAIATAFLPQRVINAVRQGQSQQTPAPNAKEQTKAAGEAKTTGEAKASGDAKEQAASTAAATTTTTTKEAAKPAAKAKAKAKAGQGRRGQGSKKPQKQQKQHKSHSKAQGDSQGAKANTKCKDAHGAKAAQAHAGKAQHSQKSQEQAPQAGKKKKARVASAAKAFARKAKEAQAEKTTTAEAKSSTTTVNADAAVGAELKNPQLTAQQNEQQQQEQKNQSASALGLNLEPVTIPQEATPTEAAYAAAADTAPASAPVTDTSTDATATAQPATAETSSETAQGLSLESVTVPTGTVPQPEATTAAAKAEDNDAVESTTAQASESAAVSTLGLDLELAPVTVPTTETATETAASADTTAPTASAAPTTVPAAAPASATSSAAHSDAQDTAALTTLPEPSEAHHLNLSLEPVTVADGNLPLESGNLSAGDSTESLSKDALFGGFTAETESSDNLSLATAATDNASAADSTAPKAKDASEQSPAKAKKAPKQEVDADHAFEEVVHPELRRKPLINGLTEALKYVLYFITHQDELKDAQGNSGAVLRNPQAPLSVQKLWQEDKLLEALAEPWDDYVL